MDSDDEIPVDFFIDQSYVLNEVEVNGIQQIYYALNTASTDYDLTGQVIWPGATFLGRFLLDNFNIVQNQTVIELGAGAGLTGLLISHLTQKIILTDGNDYVMELLEKNKQFARCDIEIRKLDWSDQYENSEKFDIIIGSDVVYWEDSIQPLFGVIRAIMNPEGHFYMCYTARNGRTHNQLLLQTDNLGFLCETLANEGKTYIYKFSFK